MKPRHIIFDLDGTLIDSAVGILESLENALRECEVRAVRPLIPDLIGPPLIPLLEELTGSKLTEELEVLVKAFRAHYDSHGYKKSTPFPGVQRVLTLLASRGTGLSIATNKPESATKKILDHLGWSGLFSDVVTPNQVSSQCIGKTQVLEVALSRLPGISHNLLYVGDREEDAVAAQAHQIPFAFAAWGYGKNSQPMLSSHSVSRLRNPQDLI